MTAAFRTIVPVRRCAAPISHVSTILCLGSCFAEHIGDLLFANRFRAVCNPTGPLFNPASIAAALRRLHKGKDYSSDEIFRHEGLWKSFDHHSRFAGSDPGATLAAMNRAFEPAASQIQRLDCLIVTFGTAAVFYHKEQKRIVANCHKLPHDRFERRLLTIDEIVAEYRELFSFLLADRPSLSIVMTVSPVRHLRDDPHENLVSKSRLIAAIDELERSFPALYYFPAYEIMMDELRDYRFYDADMAHPNATAVNYIWEKFCEACVVDRSREFMQAFESVRAALGHRIERPESDSAEKFGDGIREKIEDLRQQFPEVNFGAI
jgi:hypothetical protein